MFHNPFGQKTQDHAYFNPFQTNKDKEEDEVLTIDQKFRKLGIQKLAPSFRKMPDIEEEAFEIKQNDSI